MAAALALAFGAASAEAGDGAEYRFGPQDRVRIKVVEWRAGEAEYHEWQALTGEYGVGAGGSVSLPLIGMVPAEGVTAHDLGSAIAEKLQTRASLSVRPDVSVEVAQFRPVYVAGDVDRPGSYDFRPGLTVLQAVSIAGGIYRLRESGLIRLERDAITARGTMEQKRQELMRLLARRARLKAEKDGGAVAPIDELAGHPDAPRLIADEVKVMTSRAATMTSQLDALADLKGLLQKEIVSLGAKIKTMDAQLASGRRDLAGVMGLVSKGLATNSRQFTLEWQIADLDGRKIDFETAILRARQDVSKADRDILTFKSDFMADVDVQIQATDAAIDQARTTIDTQRGLLAEASVITPQMMASQSAKTGAEPSYVVVRQIGGASVETSVDERESLRPGDVLRVRQRFDAAPDAAAPPDRTSEATRGRSAY